MRIALPLCLAVLFVVTAARAAEPQPYDWGPVIKTFEVASEGDYKGTFTRRGTSNVYDAEWIFVPTKQKFVDVLEVRGIANGQLIIHRRGNNGTYTMPITDGRMGRGKASWVSDPNFYWEAAVIAAPAAPAAAPAATTAAAPSAPKAPAAPASAERPERWVVAKSKDGATGYDAASIKPGPIPGTISVISAFYVTKGLSGDGLKWKYEFIDAEYNCAAKTHTLMTRALKDDAGETVTYYTPKKDRAEWVATATSPFHVQMRGIVCEKAALTGAREVGSFHGALKGLKQEAIGTAAAAVEDKALAKVWWLVSKTGGGAFGYDARSIRKAKTAGNVEVRWAIYSPTPIKNNTGDWSFGVTATEFNCAAKTSAMLSMVIYDLGGKHIDMSVPIELQWNPVPAQGMQPILQQLACQNANLDGARDVGAFDALFGALKDVAR